MPSFQYVARRSTGETVRGTLEAAGSREVLNQLAETALFPLSVEETKEERAARGGRVRARHVVRLYGQLSDLLRSGVPLLRSLEILQKQSTHPGLARIIADVRDNVAGGKTLADAMARHPLCFGELVVSMVRAGQEGGFLEDVLRHVAEFTEHQEELKARMIGAMAYPAFLFMITIGVLIVMLTFFVPRFELVFERMRSKGNLPALTEALLGTSAFLSQNWYLVAGGVAIVISMIWTALASDEGRRWWDRTKLRIPVVRHIWLGWAIARFSRILGTLLANGVPILTALRVSKDSTGNRVLAAAIDRAADNVSAGETVAAPLRASGEFPPEIVEMIAIGEESNHLESVLVGIAESTERRLTRQVDLLVRMLEPLLLLMMAGVTLLVVAALLLPVFKAGTAL